MIKQLLILDHSEVDEWGAEQEELGHWLDQRSDPGLP